MDVIIAMTYEERTTVESRGFVPYFLRVHGYSHHWLQRNQTALSVEMHHHEIIFINVIFDKFISLRSIRRIPEILEQGKKAVEQNIDEILAAINNFSVLSLPPPAILKRGAGGIKNSIEGNISLIPLLKIPADCTFLYSIYFIVGGYPLISKNRPIAFWIFALFLFLSIFLMLIGQTMSVFDYDLTVHLGLQESPEQVGEFGVQVNRAFGMGDTVVYIPLLIASLIGLWLKKRWALIVTGAVTGVSAYWSVTVSFIMLFLRGNPGYNYLPGFEIWIFVGAYLFFGVLGFIYLVLHGDRLIQ